MDINSSNRIVRHASLALTEWKDVEKWTCSVILVARDGAGHVATQCHGELRAKLPTAKRDLSTATAVGDDLGVRSNRDALSVVLDFQRRVRIRSLFNCSRRVALGAIFECE